ncbi:hypothetical protein ACWGJ2_37785 [Streptomyces sp. NPDC054796]|uniref:Uncharacterized protein n=1 Tax=Streptomyces daliensis TaxID=299421 RepID=A0A8T4IXU8_9ACTN|nr:hypothetical protein [Streptomyces daliensis]
MTGGSGHLGLKKGETLTQGSVLDEAAKDLDEVRKSLEGDGGFLGIGSVMNIFGPDRFGDYGATAAFNSFSTAWNLECHTLAGALRELHGKIGDGVKLNDGNDHDTGRGLDSISSGLFDQRDSESKAKESLTQTGPEQGSSAPR